MKKESFNKDWTCNGKPVTLPHDAEFEGVYKNATVSLNGKEIAFHAYGYTRFFVELGELNFGKENTLTVVADNSRLPNSRWYSGSGIYRPVWVYVCEKDGLHPESVKISTVSIDPTVVKVEAPIPVKAEVERGSGSGSTVIVELDAPIDAASLVQRTTLHTDHVIASALPWKYPITQ